MNIKNKVIVVTGGGCGIGREIVLFLLKRGARVAAVDINEIALQETKRISKVNSDKLSLHVLDITNKTLVEKLPDEIIDKHDVVDGIINNAGIIQKFVKVNNLEYSAIEKVMNVDFYGTLYMTKAFLPYLLKRPEAYIVNLSSMGGFLPVPGQSIYGAAKAAVKLLTEGLRAELSETNVHVTVVFPGAIDTNIMENSSANNLPEEELNSKRDKLKPLPASKAAQIIVKGIEKNKSRVFVGKDAKITNFLYNRFPNFATEIISKQMKSLLVD